MPLQTLRGDLHTDLSQEIIFEVVEIMAAAEMREFVLSGSLKRLAKSSRPGTTVNLH